MPLKELDLFKGEVDKVEIAKERLRAFEPEEGYYLAFSGGKDSQVIYHLALEAGVKFDAHFNVTTIDPPELLRFIKEYYPGVEWRRPARSMWKWIETQGLPQRTQRWCCRVLKESGGRGRHVVTGVRAGESSRRSGRKMVEACYRDSRRHYINPIIDWTEDDVWAFIHDRELPYCCLYDEGFKRIGCIACPMAGPEGQKRHFERWPNFRKAYLLAIKRMLEAYKERGKEIKENWETPESTMRWWMNKQPPGDPDQKVMFE